MIHYVKTHDRFVEGTSHFLDEIMGLAEHFPFSAKQKNCLGEIGWKRSVDPQLVNEGYKKKMGRGSGRGGRGGRGGGRGGRRGGGRQY